MKKWILVVAVALSFRPSLSWADVWANSLEALDKTPAAQRDAAWTARAQKLVLDAMPVQTTDDPWKGMDLSDQALERFDALRQDAAFMKKRGAAGLALFRQRLTESYDIVPALQKLTAFVDRDPNAAALSFEAGKLVRQTTNHSNAVPFFAKSVTTPGDPRCPDEDLGLAVVGGLGLPRSGNEAVVDASAKLASTICWDALRPALVKAFSADQGYYRDNSCPFLKEKKALSKLQSKFCDSK